MTSRKKRGEDGNTNNWISPKWKELFKWNKGGGCNGPPVFKSGSCRLRSSYVIYKQNLPISDVNYVNKEY